MWYSKVLKVTFWVFFLFPTIDCNGVFSLIAIAINISIVIMIPKSLSYRAGCQLVS